MSRDDESPEAEVEMRREIPARTVHFLASGEEVSRELSRVADVQFLPDGRGVLAKQQRTAVVYRDPVPATLAEAQRWLAGVTNAQIDDQTGALVWK